nr:MAG: RNA-dependent RNA polymerase [Wufeng shrew martellivirus 1]
MERDGYCYLKLFRAYNDATHECVFDLCDLEQELGRYPRVRDVMALLVRAAKRDVYLPRVIPVGSDCYHVCSAYGVMRLSGFIGTLLFSSARIGGTRVGDACVMHNERIKRVGDLVELAGVDFRATMAEAAKIVMRDETRRDGGQLVREVCVNGVAMTGRVKNFVVNYNLDVGDIAQLQQDYKDLNVVVRPTTTHEHSFPAAATLCAEEFILRLTRYHKSSPPLTASKDCFLVDIGANWYRHASQSRFNIHCCVPVIDHRDSARETERRMRMKLRVQRRESDQATLDRYTAPGGSKARCFNRAQDCRVKANCGMLVHSQYDISLEDFMRALDAHEFDIVYTVMIFDLQIAYKTEGIIDRLKATFTRRVDADGVERVYFDFSGDPSMGYSHDYADYMRTLTSQILTTPNGRTYVVERQFQKSGQLFMRYTYCEVPPMVDTARLHFSFWDRRASQKMVVISTWTYDDGYFRDSEFRKVGVWTPVRFRRKYLELSERLFELIMGHCLRSGDKSFNINEIFSAALSFNTRMTINGNDIRSDERIATTDLMEAVVACYCISYKIRYCAGKTVEQFTKQEKGRRERGSIGFTAVAAAVWRAARDTGCLLNGVMSVWNSIVEWTRSKKKCSDLDVEMLDSVRKIEYSELLTVYDEHKDGRAQFLTERVQTIDARIDEDGALVDAVVQLVGKRFDGGASSVSSAVPVPVSAAPIVARPVAVPVSAEGAARGHVVGEPASVVPDAVAPSSEPAVASPVVVVGSPVVASSSRGGTRSNRERRVAALRFSSIVNSRASERSKRVLGSVRRESVYECCERRVIVVEGDGHCLFRALSYHTPGYDHIALRRLIYECATEEERKDLAYCLIEDGSRAGWGGVDVLAVFSRVFRVSVCAHIVMVGSVERRFVTRAYGGVYDECVHIEWTAQDCQDSESGYGHVNAMGDRLVLSREWGDISGLRDGFRDSVTSMSQAYDLIHASRMKRFGDVTANLLRIGKYVNRSAYKLEELMRGGFSVNVNDRVLDIGGAPGGFLQVLTEAGVKSVTSVSVSDDYRRSCFSSDYRIVIGDIRTCVVDGMYDVVVCDVAVEGSYRDHELFLAALRIVRAGLVGGGKLLIKSCNFFTCPSGELCRMFGSVRCVKPFTSRAGNSEVYYVCENYGSSCESVDETGVRERLVEGMNVYYDAWSARVVNALPTPRLAAALYGETVERLRDVSTKEEMMAVLGTAGYVDCFEGDMLDDMVPLLAETTNSSVFRERLIRSVRSAVPIGHLAEPLRRLLDSCIADLENNCLDRYFLPVQRVQRWCERNVRSYGIVHSMDGIKAEVIPKYSEVLSKVVNFVDVQDSQAVDAIVEMNERKKLVLPGRHTMVMPSGCVNVASYGVHGTQSVNVKGVAADVSRGVRLGNVTSDLVRRADVSVTVSGERVDGVCPGTAERPYVVASAPAVAMARGVSVDSGFDEWRTVVSGGKSVPGDSCGEDSDCELGSAIGESSFRDEVASSVADSTMSLNDTSDTASVATAASGVSWRRVFKRGRRHLDGPRIESEAAVIEMLDKCREGGVSVCQYVTFPSGARVAVSLVRSEGPETVCVGSGMRRALGLASSHVSRRRLDEKYGCVVLNGVKCNVVYRKDVLCFLIRPGECDSPGGVFSMFMKWYDRVGGGRVALDGLREVNALELCDIVRGSEIPMVFHDHHNDVYDYIKGVASGPVAGPTSGMRAFPKLGDSALGVNRSPDYIPGDGAEVSFRNAMIEFRHSISLADSLNATELSWYVSGLRDSVISSVMLRKLKTDGAGCYDNQNKIWVTDDGVGYPRKFSYGFCVNGYVRWNAKTEKFDTDCRYVIVTRRTEVMLNEEILRQIGKIDVTKTKMPKITWVNGVPGCGKTKYVIENHVKSTPDVCGDLVLTITREGVNDVRKRVGESGSVPSHVLRRDYRTVASVLVNGIKDVSYRRVFVDEALMVHAGQLGFVAALTECDEMVLLGDVNQIPFVDRDHVCVMMYSNPVSFCSVSKNLDVTYRCPIDVAYALGNVYPNISSTSAVLRSMKVVDYSPSTLPRVDALYLVHYQAEKDWLLREGYGAISGASVLTINEAQGLTAKRVVCVRSNPKDLSLFRDNAFAVVAISRSTVSFEYHTVCSDAITNLVHRATCVDDETLNEWNVKRRLGRAGYFPGLKYYDVRVGRTGYEEALVGLPHDTHEHLRLRETAGAQPVNMRGYRAPMRDTDWGYIQQWYDDKLPGVSALNYENDQECVEMSDLVLNIDRIRLNASDGNFRRRRYDRLRPAIHTLSAASRVPSQRESVLGAMKRNLNAPVLTAGRIDPVVLGRKLFDNFVLSAIREDARACFEEFENDTVRVSPQDLEEWLGKQPPSVRKNACDETPAHLRRTNCFSFMIKPTIKPALEVSAVGKYASVQTIAFLPKSVNAMFCPIMNVLSERMFSVLSEKIMVMTGLSNMDFEREVNARVSAYMLGKCSQVENDMSKYDKAQGEALLVFECLLFRALGMSAEDVQVWRNSHANSYVRDRVNGISFQTRFQRKSGDASTFFGNTMVLLAVLLACYNIDDVSLLLASGDDSVVFFNPGTLVEDDPSPIIADLFNLECKLLERYNFPYFCSKFLVITPSWIYFVPDVLKFVTKLGRLDLVNFKHVEEYRISCVDSMGMLLNDAIVNVLNACVYERYKGEIYDLTKLLRVLNTYVHDPALFASLYSGYGRNLCPDPSRPRLD